MSALNELMKKSNLIRTSLEWSILITHEQGGEATASWAAEELAAVDRLVVVVRDVNGWLKTIDLDGTGHQRSLESALAEYDKCRAA